MRCDDMKYTHKPLYNVLLVAQGDPAQYKTLVWAYISVIQNEALVY